MDTWLSEWLRKSLGFMLWSVMVDEVVAGWGAETWRWVSGRRTFSCVVVLALDVSGDSCSHGSSSFLLLLSWLLEGSQGGSGRLKVEAELLIYAGFSFATHWTY